MPLMLMRTDFIEIFFPLIDLYVMCNQHMPYYTVFQRCVTFSREYSALHRHHMVVYQVPTECGDSVLLYNIYACDFAVCGPLISFARRALFFFAFW